MSNKLEQLKAMTLVVADTGDIEAMKRFKPARHASRPIWFSNIQKTKPALL